MNMYPISDVYLKRRVQLVQKAHDKKSWKIVPLFGAHSNFPAGTASNGWNKSGTRDINYIP